MNFENLPFDMMLENLKHMRYEDLASYCLINRQHAKVCRNSQGQEII